MFVSGRDSNAILRDLMRTDDRDDDGVVALRRLHDSNRSRRRRAGGPDLRGTPTSMGSQRSGAHSSQGVHGGIDAGTVEALAALECESRWPSAAASLRMRSESTLRLSPVGPTRSGSPKRSSSGSTRPSCVRSCTENRDRCASTANRKFRRTTLRPHVEHWRPSESRS